MQFRRHLFSILHLFCITLTISSLTGCSLSGKQRSFTPLEYVHYTTKPQLEKRLAKQNFEIGDPVYIRAFKSEMQMEVWLQREPDQPYELFRTYPICRASGTLGPKVKEGDEQAPEGFYTVGMNQLNPNSKFFLSFNLGYPNAYDRANKRTGNALMVHGNCVSKGCLAMNDQNIGEIYLLVEESLKKSENTIPVHIFPFKMTEEMMNLRQYSQWYPFWQNLKEGYDVFEKTHLPPIVNATKKKYTFEANASSLSSSFKMAQK